MFAIVYKSDGVPICVQMPGVSPDPVVVWNSESAAKAFIDSKGGAAEFQLVLADEQAMEKMAKALGFPVDEPQRLARCRELHRAHFSHPFGAARAQGIVDCATGCPAEHGLK